MRTDQSGEGRGTAGLELIVSRAAGCPRRSVGRQSQQDRPLAQIDDDRDLPGASRPKRKPLTSETSGSAPIRPTDGSSWNFTLACRHSSVWRRRAEAAASPIARSRRPVGRVPVLREPCADRHGRPAERRSRPEAELPSARKRQEPPAVLLRHFRLPSALWPSRYRANKAGAGSSGSG